MVKIARTFTVDHDVYEKARKDGINMSEAAEEGLRARIAETRIKGKDILEKFRGLPAHVVRRARQNVVEDEKNAPLTAAWLSAKFGVRCTESEVKALVPRF